MVVKNAYLFIGADPLAKDARIQKIKEEHLGQSPQYFNFDVLHAKELNLPALQEKILYLPLKSAKRVIVIRDTQHLKTDCRNFMLDYLTKPDRGVVLIFEIERYNPKDEFIGELSRLTQAARFNEPVSVNTFTLSRQIGARKTLEALKVLNQLLENGEKPERILGGLRYAGENDARRIKALLDCDIDIKTGRLKAPFALEKLVIRLCSFGKPVH